MPLAGLSEQALRLCMFFLTSGSPPVFKLRWLGGGHTARGDRSDVQIGAQGQGRRCDQAGVGQLQLEVIQQSAIYADGQPVALRLPYQQERVIKTYSL